MKKIFILLVNLGLIYGCEDISKNTRIIDHVNIKIIGDKSCYFEQYGRSYPHLAGIKSDCVGERSVTSEDMPDDFYKHIFISFGSFETDMNAFRNDLNNKLSSTSATVYCILPDINDSKNIDAVDVINDTCPNVINPRDHGFTFEYEGFGSYSDHLRFGNWMADFVDTLN